MAKKEKPKADKRALWFNLQQLMTAQWGAPNLRRLANEAGIGEMTVYRLRDEDPTAIGLEVIEAVARVFRRLPYQVLDPRPGATSLSAPALEIARMFDALPGDQQPRAYALVLQLLEFGNAGPTPTSPSGAPNHNPGPAAKTPPEPSPVSPSPRRAPGKSPRATAGGRSR